MCVARYDTSSRISEMHCLTIFITALCVIFPVKIQSPKNKNLYKLISLRIAHFRVGSIEMSNHFFAAGRRSLRGSNKEHENVTVNYFRSQETIRTSTQNHPTNRRDTETTAGLRQLKSD